MTASDSSDSRDPRDIRSMHRQAPERTADRIHEAEVPYERNGATADVPTIERTVKDQFLSAVMTANEILEADIHVRESIIDPFFKQADLGFIYGPRGGGKTWLATHLAASIARGSRIGDWKVARPARTLIVDGEMNLDATQERLRLLEADCDFLEILHHEALFAQTEGQLALNLADPTHQEGISALAKRDRIEVVVFDNLSCLFRGMIENDADDWEKVLPWLLNLRRAGIAVIIVHHAGRAGNMRGTSRREDAAHWVLSVEDPGDQDDSFPGARFKTRFTKNRNTTDAECPVLLWEFKTVEGAVQISTQPQSDQLELVSLVLGGIDSNKELSAELGVTKGTISKWARRAAADGKIRIANGRYLPP